MTRDMRYMNIAREVAASDNADHYLLEIQFPRAGKKNQDLMRYSMLVLKI